MIDIENKVRGGKIMRYDSSTGKRTGSPFMTYNKSEYNYKACLFGEHLLSKDKFKKVAIVESEKTAIIASGYLPQFIWIASSGKKGLTDKKYNILKGRKVILYPDLDAFEVWTKTAKEISLFTPCIVSDILEKKAKEESERLNISIDEVRKLKYDIADLLVRLDKKRFVFNPSLPSPASLIKSTIQKKEKKQTSDFDFTTSDSHPIHVHSTSTQKICMKKEDVKKENWTERIEVIKRFYSNHDLSKASLSLVRNERILNTDKFFRGHLAMIEWNNGNHTFLPYLHRLENAVNILLAGDGDS
jgi:hypothetical protein